MIHHPMLSFSAARCSVPLHPDPRPRATIACRRWPCDRNRPTAASAKPRRWSRGPRRDRSWGDGDDGSGSDSDVDDGFFGAGEDDDEEEAEREEPAPPAPQLRGSDVLRALQRAVAAKEAARKNKDNKPAARQRQRQGKEKPEGRDVEVGDVRPVVIRPEWAGRIRELELRVRQLVDKYHQ
ncbi:hypothetical protein U9M48_029970 [Paspalum notatum var. saurae]|uniref:Uncharacterized protein n=1 Tax=Paspalum notatum var. saurae TaxID=547442 RepID=A0AAQ3TZ37_PASNO